MGNQTSKWWGLVPQGACQGDNRAVERAALEALALEGVRTGKLSTGQVRRLLGFGTRYEVHGFLKSHGVYLEMTPEEIERDARAAAEFSR